MFTNSNLHTMCNCQKSELFLPERKNFVKNLSQYCLVGSETEVLNKDLSFVMKKKPISCIIKYKRRDFFTQLNIKKR